MGHIRQRSIRGLASVVAMGTLALCTGDVAGHGGIAEAASAHSLPALLVPTCTKLAITVHSASPGSILVVYRLVVSNPSARACKVSGSPGAQAVAGTNHHAVGLPAQATKIKGAGNTPGNLTLTLPAHGTLARHYATYEIDTQGVVYAMHAQCHAVASNGVRITFPHTTAVVVPLMSYHVCTLAKVTYIGGMAKY